MMSIFHASGFYSYNRSWIHIITIEDSIVLSPVVMRLDLLSKTPSYASIELLQIQFFPANNKNSLDLFGSKTRKTLEFFPRL